MSSKLHPHVSLPVIYLPRSSRAGKPGGEPKYSQEGRERDAHKQGLSQLMVWKSWRYWIVGCHGIRPLPEKMWQLIAYWTVLQAAFISVLHNWIVSKCQMKCDGTAKCILSTFLLYLGKRGDGQWEYSWDEVCKKRHLLHYNSKGPSDVVHTQWLHLYDPSLPFLKGGRTTCHY